MTPAKKNLQHAVARSQPPSPQLSLIDRMGNAIPHEPPRTQASLLYARVVHEYGAQQGDRLLNALLTEGIAYETIHGFQTDRRAYVRCLDAVAVGFVQHLDRLYKSAQH